MSGEHGSQHEFDSWRSYQDFAERVRRNRRFVWENEDRRFLETVLATNRNRDTEITAGSIWFRAQQGVKCLVDDQGSLVEIRGLPAERMRPLRDRAREGRANSSGIPVLYLASMLDIAISEVRPWVGSDISVATFRILRDLKAIDLSITFGSSPLDFLIYGQLLTGETIDAEGKTTIVWADIDNAFSQPVTWSDSSADYVPTQILSELFMDAGYDAIAYRSQFGDDGYNLALFSLDDAEIVDCAPYRVDSIEVGFSQIGHPWFLRDDNNTAEMDVDE